MARPTKSGLDYFPFGCDFFHQRPIRALTGRFGSDGVAVYLYILSEIYGDKGYYVTIDDDFIDVASCDLAVAAECIEKIVDFLADRSLMTRLSMGSDMVYTSADIQRTFQIVKKSLRRDIEVDGSIWLLRSDETFSFIKIMGENSEDFRRQCSPSSPKSSKSEILHEETTVNTEKTAVNPGFTTQRKGKERKEKESKAEERKEEREGSAAAEKILEIFKKNGIGSTSSVRATVSQWLLRSSPDIVQYAVTEAEACGKVSVRYIDAILARYLRDGLKTVEDVMLHDKKRGGRFRDKDSSVYRQGSTDYSLLEAKMNARYE